MKVANDVMLQCDKVGSKIENFRLELLELARLVGLTASGVTRMLAPMEKIGLVTKEAHPRDARLSLVKLTESGETKYQDTSTTVGQVADSFVETLSSAQRDALEHLRVGLISNERQQVMSRFGQLPQNRVAQ